MPTIDLHYAIPEVLAESASYNDLLQTVQAITDWDERQARVLDHVYQQRLLRLLTARDPIDRQQKDVRTLIDHLERVTHQSRLEQLNSLDQPYSARWQTLRDILASRLAALESHAPGQVLERNHVEKILLLIAEAGTIRQSELRAALGLRSANLTRILNIMEANLLIERRTVGREKMISPGLAAENLLRPQTPEADVARGSTYFCPCPEAAA